MSALSERVERAISNRRLLRCGESLLVAVSGGVDSMVLLRLLHELAPKYRWQITVAHLNHQLRGHSSDADEKLVCDTAARLSLRCIVERGDVKQFAKARKRSIEMAARELRHDFLARTAKRLRIKTVALAHHADDQVELFFLRLVRGAGSDGLGGMKWRSLSPSDSTVTLIRPLLAETKSALADDARENRIAFREDATNRRVDFPRNWIRHEMLPLLQKKFGPSVLQNVLRTMELVREEGNAVADIANRWLKVRKPRFKSLSIAVQRCCIKSQLLNDSVLPEFDLIEQLRTRPDQLVSVATDKTARLDSRGTVWIESATAREFKTGFRALNLANGEARCAFSTLKMSATLSDRKKGLSLKPTRHQEIFDAEKIGNKIVLRHWRPGDRFQPIGSRFAVKLQNFFINEKVSAERRRSLILATTSVGEIFWVEDMRIGEKFKVTPHTKRLLILRWKTRAD